jgi:ATP-dependent RNA helicase DeaD
MKFEELDVDPVFLGNIQKMGFEEMFPVQKESIPQALQGKDLVVQAKTGSGKTIGFAIPLCEAIDAQQKSVQALVLAPTRELAVQVHGEIEKLCEGTKIWSHPVYGGVSLSPQIKAIENGTQIVVGTPGRIMDLMRRGNLRFKNLKVVVLDEGDRMFDMGFRDDIEFILSETPKNRQTMLFSATVPPEIEDLIQRNLNNPQTIRIGNVETDITQVDQYYIDCDYQTRFNILCNYIEKENITQAIVFCNTKRECENLTRNLKNYKFQVHYLHGDLSQKQRDRSMELFREGKIRILIATDIAARGLDIEGVSHVINYDVPIDSKNYVHRIGRTARAGEHGIAVTFLIDKFYDDFRKINKELRLQVEPLVVETTQTYYFKRNQSNSRGRTGGRFRSGSRGSRYGNRRETRGRGYNPALGHMGTGK